MNIKIIISLVIFIILLILFRIDVPLDTFRRSYEYPGYTYISAHYFSFLGSGGVLAGIALVIGGVALAIYASSSYSAVQQRLRQTDLTQQERYEFEGSLVWWTKTNGSLYYPLAAILAIIGIVILILMFILRP